MKAERSLCVAAESSECDVSSKGSSQGKLDGPLLVPSPFHLRPESPKIWLKLLEFWEVQLQISQPVCAQLTFSSPPHDSWPRMSKQGHKRQTLRDID